MQGPNHCSDIETPALWKSGTLCSIPKGCSYPCTMRVPSSLLTVWTGHMRLAQSCFGNVQEKCQILQLVLCSYLRPAYVQPGQERCVLLNHLPGNAGLSAYMRCGFICGFDCSSMTQLYSLGLCVNCMQWCLTCMYTLLLLTRYYLKLSQVMVHVAIVQHPVTVGCGIGSHCD